MEITVSLRSEVSDREIWGSLAERDAQDSTRLKERRYKNRTEEQKRERETLGDKRKKVNECIEKRDYLELGE